MDEEIGIIDSVEGSLAYVTFATKGECEKCGACAGGGGKILARNDARASVGDRVRVESSNRTMLAVSFVVFGLPICATFAGIGAGALIASATGGNSALLSGILAAALFVASIAFAVAYDRKAKRESSTVFRIVETICPDPEENVC